MPPDPDQPPAAPAPEALTTDLPDLSRGPVPSSRQHRYPWHQWAKPGNGPFLVAREAVDPRRLSGVLRTYGARRALGVRTRHLPEGLLFQFGPPYSPLLPDTEPVRVRTGRVRPGTCPTCHQLLPGEEPYADAETDERSA